MAHVAPSLTTAPVPPQNLDAEESVLGAMMLSPGAIGAISEVLSASDFYRESHAKIYRAGLTLYGRGEPVDAITLVDELDRRGELEDAGGKVRIHELAALVPAAANAAHYARIVREMATLRGLIRAGQEISRDESFRRVAKGIAYVPQGRRLSLQHRSQLGRSPGADQLDRREESLAREQPGLGRPSGLDRAHHHGVETRRGAIKNRPRRS